MREEKEVSRGCECNNSGAGNFTFGVTFVKLCRQQRVDKEARLTLRRHNILNISRKKALSDPRVHFMDKPSDRIVVFGQ
jgi:hypothetical protein